MKKKDDLLNLEQNNKKDLKKPLIYGAIAFLVFIIGVLIFAIYSNTSLNEDRNVVIPPEEKEEKAFSFKEIPIEEDLKNDSLVIKKLVDNDAKQDIKENKEYKEKNVTNNITQNEELKSIKKMEEEPKVDNIIQKERVKPVKKIEEEPIKKAEKQEVATYKKAIKNYYVQVGALMKNTKPNESFLALIKEKGYNYKLHEVSSIKDEKRVEVIKILIGPFSKEEVGKEFLEIKKKISKNAFIYRIK